MTGGRRSSGVAVTNSLAYCISSTPERAPVRSVRGQTRPNDHPRCGAARRGAAAIYLTTKISRVPYTHAPAAWSDRRPTPWAFFHDAARCSQFDRRDTTAAVLQSIQLSDADWPLSIHRVRFAENVVVKIVAVAFVAYTLISLRCINLLLYCWILVFCCMYRCFFCWRNKLARLCQYLLFRLLNTFHLTFFRSDFFTCSLVLLPHPGSPTHSPCP